MKITRLLPALMAGAALGAALYFAPFLFFPLRFILGMVLIVSLVRWAVFGWGWRRRWAYAGYGHGPGPWGHERRFASPADFTDRIRSMTPEEYEAFKAQRMTGCHGRGWKQTAQGPQAQPKASQEPDDLTL